MKDRKPILKLLQQLGSVQLDNLREDEFFLKNDTTKNLSDVERQMAIVEEALKILDAHVPENKSMLDSLKGRQELTLETYEEMAEKQDEFYEIAERIRGLERRTAECIAEMHRVQVQIDALSPWCKLDIPLQFKGTRQSSAFIGTLPNEVSLEQLLTEMANLIPEVDAVHADIISKSKEQTCIFVLCHRNDEAVVDGALREMGFARPSASSSNLPPAKQKSGLEGTLEALAQKYKITKTR